MTIIVPSLQMGELLLFLKYLYSNKVDQMFKELRETPRATREAEQNPGMCSCCQWRSQVFPSWATDRSALLLRELWSGGVLPLPGVLESVDTVGPLPPRLPAKWGGATTPGQEEILQRGGEQPGNLRQPAWRSS